jgi:large repetitive protein
MTTALTGGYQTILAVYSGDSVWPRAQASYGQAVNTPLTFTLTASPKAPVYGQSVTLTATVAATVPAGIPAPTGQVTFSMAGANPFSPGTPLGTMPLASGTTTFTLTNPAVGTETILAQYSGDSTWNASSTSLTVTEAPDGSSVSISEAISGGQLALLSTVTAAAPGAGTPTGSVRFVDTASGTTIASANLSAGKASATVAASQAVYGRPIAALYSGDANFASGESAALPATGNAASDSSASFADGEIASVFGIAGLSGNASATLPLGTTLGGATVTVTDSAGTSTQALLYGVFASSGQINFIVPSGAADGLATVTIALAGGEIESTVIDIVDSAPGIFTVSQNGSGVWAGQVIYVAANGMQTMADSIVFTGSGAGAFVPNPVNVGAPGTSVYLVLYGTGLGAAKAVSATIGGVSVPVSYFGAQGNYQGLDQVNLGPLPASLAGAGLVNLVVTAGRAQSNIVTVDVE